MHVVLVLILLFLLLGERQLKKIVGMRILCQFFHKKAGSQKDNQAQFLVVLRPKKKIVVF